MINFSLTKLRSLLDWTWFSCANVSLSVAQKTKLEAAHRKFQRRILEISWKDKVNNERVRDETQLEKIELIKERRLRWLWHVLRMDDKRLPRQAIFWDSSDIKRKPGRPRKNWTDTVQRDLKDIGMTWEEVQQLAVDRGVWRRSAVQCIFDTGWTQFR